MCDDWSVQKPASLLLLPEQNSTADFSCYETGPTADVDVVFTRIA